jgi:hypothetical protein
LDKNIKEITKVKSIKENKGQEEDKENGLWIQYSCKYRRSDRGAESQSVF